MDKVILFKGKLFWIEYRLRVGMISFNKLLCFSGNCAYRLKTGVLSLWSIRRDLTILFKMKRNLQRVQQTKFIKNNF